MATVYQPQEEPETAVAVELPQHESVVIPFPMPERRPTTLAELTQYLRRKHERVIATMDPEQHEAMLANARIAIASIWSDSLDHADAYFLGMAHRELDY